MLKLPVILSASSLLPLTLVFGNPNTCQSTDHPTDLSIYDAPSSASLLGTQFSPLTVIVTASECDECGADTPQLDTPLWLSSDPDQGPPPVNGTFLDIFIEFTIENSVVKGECAPCDKMCKFDLSWRVVNDSTGYSFLLDTFPAADDPDPTSFVTPGNQHVNSYDDREYYCGDSSDYTIDFSIFTADGSEELFTFERVYEIGGANCETPPQDPI